MSSPQSGQQITLYDTYVEVTVSGVKKLLSWPTFKELFDRVMTREETVLDPIIMPSHALTFGKTPTVIEVNTYWPESKVKVQYLDKYDTGNKPITYEVPFPNILLYFKLTLRGEVFNVDTAKYLCTPHPVGKLLNTTPKFFREANPKEGIYVLPMPNIYAEARACYGQNSMPQGFKIDFRGLDWYYLFLHNSTFNSDLSVPGVGRSYNPKDWLIHLSKLDKFPYDLLTSRS